MAVRVVQWIFAVFLLAVGGYLAVRGWDLISLGGSWYYAITGVGLVLVAVLTAIGSLWAPRLWALIVAATIVWAIYESGLDLLALLPRLAAFVAVGLWFAMPWTRAHFSKAAPMGDADYGGAPPKRPFRWPELTSLAGLAVLILAGMQPWKVEQGSKFEVAANVPAVTDWRFYGNVAEGQRFAQIDQINVKNVGQLEEKWRFRTGVPYDFKNTPLEVNGLVYVCTAGNTLIALDSDSGTEKWRYDPHVKPGGGDMETASTFARTCRGVGYYEAPAGYVGECPKRIIVGTTDARLLAVDAMTGQSCQSFGFGGEVNLRSGLGPHAPPLYFVTSPPQIAGNIAVVGGWVADTQMLGMPSGVLRAYDTITGQFVWAWDMGNPGNHALPAEGAEFTRGTPNIWSIMSYDPQLNLIYAPTGNSSPDYFDGELRSEFAEKYASSVVAIDAATGEPRWSYQTVHRDIWDWDVPSQPVLVNVHRDGKVVPAVAQPTKRGEIFLLDRRDGTPIYPIEERPVPQNPEAGEKVSPTQPFSPLPNFRPDRWERDMWGVTPLDQLWCRIAYKKLRYDGHFTPPMRANGKIEGSFQYPGNAGGFNWGSVSVDADNGLLIAAPMMMGNKITLMNAEDRAKAAAERAERARREGRPAPGGQGGGGPGAGARPGQAVDPRFDPKRVTYTAATAPFMSEWVIPFTKIKTELPCFEPPYGMIGVIDLNTNKLLWKRPFGSMRNAGPFAIQTGLPFMVGTPLQSGSMTTRGGLIFHGGAMDSTLRAFDLRTGQVKWSSKLPGSAHATPMSYVSPATGKQYVVITVPNPPWRYPRPSADKAEKPSDDKGGWVIAYGLKENAK